MAINKICTIRLAYDIYACTLFEETLVKDKISNYE